MTGQQGFLIFHSVVEGFSVLVACGIFIITWNCREYMRNSYLLFVGIAYSGCRGRCPAPVPYCKPPPRRKP